MHKDEFIKIFNAAMFIMKEIKNNLNAQQWGLG